jgi:hypothetical protein
VSEANYMQVVPRTIDCPRCFQPCAWCSDYRWHHGQLKLPGSRKYCTISAMAPEGDACPMCRGSRRVYATTTYEAVSHAR